MYESFIIIQMTLKTPSDFNKLQAMLGDYRKIQGP